jgi:hypothetical protein
MTARKFTLVAIMLMASTVAASAQPLPPQAPPPPPQTPSLLPPPPPRLEAQGSSGLQGTVARLLPTPRGEVDGLLLEDGRIVRFPPHMSAALLSVVGQGDAVMIDGMVERAGSEMRAWRITNRTTNRTVTEAPPPFPPEPRVWSGRDMRVSGVVRRTLTGGRGETNGVILDDGTVVRFPPHVGEAFATILAPGARLIAQGYGSSGPAGTALEAVALGSSEGTVVSVGPGGPGGPRPR